MFARVLIALDSRVDSRDALMLGAQLGADGTLVVAHVLDTQAAPLAGGTHAGARRRDRLRDRGEEVYAILGPDPRVRYLPVSGLPLADAAIALAARERTEAIVIGQNALGHNDGAERLVDAAPCPIAVAPYGHRFARGFTLSRIAIALGDDELARSAERVAEKLACSAGAELSRDVGPSGVAQARDGVDLLVVGGVAPQLLRSARCPVLVVPSAAAFPEAVGASTPR